MITTIYIKFIKWNIIYSKWHKFTLIFSKVINNLLNGIVRFTWLESMWFKVKRFYVICVYVCILNINIIIFYIMTIIQQWVQKVQNLNHEDYFKVNRLFLMECLDHILYNDYHTTVCSKSVKLPLNNGLAFLTCLWR